jgi:ATP-binding cassette, subfamily B, bacterial
VPHWKEAREASSGLFGFLKEQLSGTEDLRSSGATDYALNEYYKRAGQRLRTERSAGIMSIWLRNANTFFYTLSYLISLPVSYYLFTIDAISVGTLSGPLRPLTRQMEGLQKASASIARIDELHDITTYVHDGLALVEGALSIEFRDLHFGYKAEDPVLSDISFRIEPRRILGLLGRTGAGKTTIARPALPPLRPTTGHPAL